MAGSMRGPDYPPSGAPGPPLGAETAAPRRHARPRRPKRRSILWRWRRPLYLSGLASVAGVVGMVSVWASIDIPEFEELDQSTFICGADVDESCNSGNAIATIQGEEDRVNVTYDDLPQVLINAVVATEDRDFFEHNGIDPLGIARAVYQNVRGDGVLQGGSTITQQYVKNAFLSPERTIQRNIEEAALSLQLEKELSKEEILEGYLNTIYFGRGAYGVQAASRVYFSKDVADLEVPEAAYLAGLLRAPVLADAARDLDEAERRRHTSLRSMAEEGYISPDEAELFDAVPLEVNEVQERSGRGLETRGDLRALGGDHITSYVRWLLENEHDIDEADIFGGGLRVYTSLDHEMQAMAWEAVTSTLDEPDDPSAALVAVDDQGLVRAMVGDRRFVAGEQESNFAVRHLGSDGRGVGSTYKAVALAEAVRKGVSLDSRFNAPATIEVLAEDDPCGAGDDVEFRNFGESEQGQLDLIEATRQSSNTAYVQLGIELTPNAVNELALELGIEPRRDEVTCNLSDVLGPNNATPLEMATVYSTFANRGVRKDPTLITRIEKVDQSGNVTTLYEWQPEERRVLQPEHADLVNYALQEVIQSGTGSSANIGVPAAGKTGTTTANKDAWFIGYVPRMTTAVWMGFPNPEPDPETGELDLVSMNSSGRPVHGIQVTGGSFPAQIWQKFMSAVVEARGWDDAFEEPSAEALRDGRILNRELLTTTTEPPETTTTTEGPPTTPGPTRPGPPRPTVTPPTVSIPEPDPDPDPDPGDPGPGPGPPGFPGPTITPPEE